jgi:hypothetical protein
MAIILVEEPEHGADHLSNDRWKEDGDRQILAMIDEQPIIKEACPSLNSSSIGVLIGLIGGFEV